MKNDVLRMKLIFLITVFFLAMGFSLQSLGEENMLNDTALDQAWTEFRGPGGGGVFFGSCEIPTQWSESQNVVWKTAIPHQGWSSPVILENNIWITTATLDGHQFYALCVDAATGEILYTNQLFYAENPEPLGNNVNSYASPTPVVESGRVYVHFGSYGTACIATDTYETLWKRSDLPCRHYRGPGSSPVVVGDLLILTFDGADVQYLVALNKHSGETVWRTTRTTDWPDLDENGMPQREGDFRKAFTTPGVFTIQGITLLVSPGSYTCFAYEAFTGREVWKFRHDSYSPAPRPILGNDLFFIVSGRGKKELWAIRPGGQGDITETHVAWKISGKIVPDEPTPLFVDNSLYLLSNDGLITCLDPENGNQRWSERLGGNYMASPIYAGGKIYCCSVQGKTVVLAAGPVFEKLAENHLEAGCLATPAITKKALFVRTKTHLYRIEVR